MLRTPQPSRLLAALAAAALLLLAAGPAAAAGSRARFLQQQQAPAAEANAPNVTASSGPGGRFADALSVGAAAADWLPPGIFSGDGTAFSEAVPNSGKGFACSYRYLNDWASTHFAAMNSKQWDNGNACGRCITAWCDDERCPTRGKRVQVLIADKCPECAHGDVDFSIPVYRDITGMWPHRLRISWEWSDCSDNMQGGIRLDPKDGINAQWQAFYFSNAKYPLKSVTINGKPLQRNEFQFWINSAPLPASPVRFDFEAENGMRVTAFSDDPLKSQELPNFE